MSRPRPPLHDPYGLLRPPPPLDTPSTSIYSANSNSLGSTVSLPLPSASPGRRNRQRGISPNRTQHGEEYDDQPYLTNVVRHHGQVTLVPPVNQGRTRKVRRRRLPEAAASTASLVEPGARPVSSAGPSRLDGEPVSQRSPRRPHHGSDTRAVSSPDVHAPYPDYPPPSFEEVIALDRRTAVPSPAIQPPTQEPTHPDISSPFQPPPAPEMPPLSPGTPRAATTPWEEDRRLGLSLEERVRRELERNLKPGTGEPSPKLVIETNNGLPPDDVAPPSSSGTPTSVAASNFLTPQNLTPSPLGTPLPLSTRTSPRADTFAPRSPSPPVVPPKSPALSLPATTGPSQPIKAENSAALSVAAVAEPQVDRLAQTTSAGASSREEQTATPQPTVQTISQGSPPKTAGPLASLLFTTRLNLNGPPEPESPTVKPRGQTPSQGYIKDAPPTPSTSKGKLKEIINEPLASISTAPEPAATPRTASPRKVLSKPRPLSELPSAVYGTSLLFQPPLPQRPPPPRPPLPASPAKLSAEIPPRNTEAAPSTPPAPKPSVDPPAPTTLSAALRRPPPPPPPRPRPRSVGAGVAARVSAYEAILANAPKVPPPIPPRPRERQQASSSAPKPGSTQEPKESVAETSTEEIKTSRKEDEATHIANTPAPRPISLFAPEPGPSRIRSPSNSRPFSMPSAPPVRSPSPERTKRNPSPER
ncbi:hypothetical protein FRC07_005989 [Ceratobasidium sp. 392]|nr:hypothetical protein FRC07_005989 [Ceratobasidium sp. 392]